MPHIDARSGEVVIRIVYDGAPEAGKTTNIQHLCNQISLARRGAAKSPGTTGARTEFFDWLDFSGGFLDGRRVRCQLVSVPGQSRLLHRRRYLLEAADVIVFVADSRSEGIEEAAHNASATLRIAAQVAGEVPVGIILQANKQDLPGAMAPPDVLRALGMPKSTPALGSVASTGGGVMDTFVLAVRLATERVRSLLKETVTDLATSAETPDGLHAAMLELEAVERERIESEQREAERLEAERRANAEHVVVEFAIRSEHANEPATLPAPPVSSTNGARKNLLQRLEDVALPQANEISSGHVWPPVKGRAAFAAATTGRLAAPEEVRRWAPASALEVASDAGWLLHSSDRWVFDSEAEARLHLLALVRRLLPQGDLVPEARALAVARDHNRWRLWLLTPEIQSVSEAAHAAAERGASTLGALLGRVGGAFRNLRKTGMLGDALPAGSDGIAVQDGRLVRLALDEGEAAPAPEARPPLAQLSELMSRLLRDREGLREWFEGEGRALLERA